MNYFELFEIPVSLRVDRSTLARKYFELQKQYHPDFFANAGADEQAEMLERSSQINKALKTFQKEELTIKYLLQQKDLLQEEEKYALPPEFLMEVMELNENMSNSSADQVAAFENDIYAPVKEIIENYDDKTTTNEELLKVKEYYFKKKYLQRILERMDD